MTDPRHASAPGGNGGGAKDQVDAGSVLPIVAPRSHEIRDDMLSTVEVAELSQHEDTITRGLQTFVEVGTALAAIRDGRLYRQTHTTFEEYCAERWGFTDRRARQIIGAAGLVAELPSGTTVPVNEAQARELVGLDPTTAAKVMQEAAASGRITSQSIRQARARIEGTEVADTDEDTVPTEAEIATLIADTIEARYAEDPDTWKIPHELSGYIRHSWPWPTHNQNTTFRDVAYPLFVGCSPSSPVWDLLGPWLYFVAEQALLEWDDLDRDYPESVGRPRPGRELARLARVLLNPDTDIEMQILLWKQLGVQIAFATLDCERWMGREEIIRWNRMAGIHRVPAGGR